MTDVNAYSLTLAYKGVTTGDQSPPHPWAHLSHMEITSVGDVSALFIEGGYTAAGFEIIAAGKLYRISIESGS